MATKWRGWTARLPVKISCVVLIHVMAFIFLLGALGLARTESSFDTGILFTDFKNCDFFFDYHMPIAAMRIRAVFDYRSEEHIREMGCLEWVPVTGYYLGENSGDETWLELTSTDAQNIGRGWGAVRESDLESAEAQRLLEGVFNNQISELYDAKEWLSATGGIYYYIANESRSMKNSPDAQADFFTAQPVYMIAQKGRITEQSNQPGGYFSRYYGNVDGLTMYIAFSQEAVDYWHSVWHSTQRQVITNIAFMLVPTFASLILLIILIVGAGRRYGDNSGEIIFTMLDKPWLDLGLALLTIYEVAVCCLVYSLAYVAWRYDNIRWLILLCALLSVGFVPPLIGWMLSFTKRCKVGGWWRHTLIYAVIFATCAACKRMVQSLWAGISLMVKVAITGTVLLIFTVLILFTESAGFGLLLCLLLTSLAVFLMLRYAHRLNILERGAAAASYGAYDAPIPLTGGELGSIAASINRISDGIGAAVAQRIRSERLKTELITNVSHDIRTPLTSLITYTDLLKKEGLSSAKAPEYLDVLIQKSARLKTLTDDLFEAAKAASGNIEVCLGNLDLSDFVRQVLGELDEQMKKSGLDFRVNLPVHAAARADGKLLWRVLENLLSNVFKYALANSRVYIDVLPEEDMWRLEVKNISELPLNIDPYELTERFKRGDGARSGEGSGLGLSIAQSFVLAQGGQFELSIDGDLFKAVVRLPGCAKCQ